MSDTNQKGPIVSKGIKRFAFGALILVIFLILGFPYTEIVLRLITGWVSFFGRVVPQISRDWVMITSGLLALFVAAWGFHRIACNFRQDWKKSWTASWILLGGLMFAASIFTTGMAHQTVWLFREPMVISRRDVSNMRQLLLGLRVYHADTESLPDRLYDLYPEYIDVPFEEGIWKVKSGNGVDMEVFYFPEVLHLSPSLDRDDLILIAAPSVSEKRWIGFLDGHVAKLPEKEYREMLNTQQKQVFEMLDKKYTNR